MNTDAVVIVTSQHKGDPLSRCLLPTTFSNPNMYGEEVAAGVMLFTEPIYESVLVIIREIQSLDMEPIWSL